MAILLMSFIERVTGSHLTHLSSPDMPDTLQIYSGEWFGAIHKTLRHLKGYTWSRYSGSTFKSGDVIGGHPHQDLLATSFLDNQFDIILTADVLEHIPEPYLAHREIYRILKPGGVHIFTVPSNMNNPLDDQRAAIVNGELIQLAPPEWHGTQEDSNLVYTVFGLEMICHLWSLGFSVRFHEISSPDKGIVGPRAIGFEAMKHHEPLLREIPTGLRSNQYSKKKCFPSLDKGQQDQFNRALKNKDRQIAEIYDSLSWKITSPLRKIYDLLFK